MATWGIFLFGNGRIARSDIGAVRLPDIFWPVLGCLLASPGYRASRSRLAAQLWPDKDEASARHCLATALWRIKAKLPGGVGPLLLSEERVALVQRHVWVDVLAFERRAAAGLNNPMALAVPRERRRLARALALCSGDFLGECDQEWIALERERLRALHLDALYELAMAEARAEDWPAARSAAQALCAAEPLREDAQRLLMRATANCGNRALAIQQYRSYERYLAAELSIRPMRETTELMMGIAGACEAPPQPPAIAPAADYRAALVRTRDEIQRTLHMVEQSLTQ